MRLPVLPIAWVSLWVLLFVISRQNHPTVILNASATTVLIGAGVSVYLLAARRGWAIGFASVVIGGIAAAATITMIYDLLDGPDPRRFDFLLNVESDSGIVPANL